MLERIVKRHSDFIPYPVRLKDKTLNSMKPVWTRPESEVKEEEFTELYHHISHDWGEPLDRLALKAEGRSAEYQALLFIPSKAPFDLYFREQRVGLQLYVRRVLIMDRFEALLPGWLRFLRGVVDSSDLQLNVSRELLQHDGRIVQMRRWMTRKVLDHLHAMKQKDDARYRKLWDEFGRVLKEGVAADSDHRERLVPLLLFASSHDAALTDLAGYRSRMKERQSEIYYLAGENRSVIEASPHLEAFADRGYEVLYLLDPIDELMVQNLDQYEGRRLRSVAEAEASLGTEEEKKSAREEVERRHGDYRELLASLQGRRDCSPAKARSRRSSSASCARPSAASICRRANACSR